jgi:CRP/FNR family transcriptional regulator, cyclic AMP receptor protein
VGEGDLKLLFGVPLLESLPRGEVERFGRALPVKGFEIGQHVYTPAYRGRMFFLLLRGQVRIYKMEGEREITLALVGRGEMFGEAAFTARRRKGAYAEALRPSRVALINHNIFRGFVEAHPLVGLKAMELLSERLSLYEERIVGMSLKKVPSRLAGILLELAQTEGVDTGEGFRIPTHYSHEQLGAMIGAKRVAVTRALTGLRQTGAVEVHRRRIHVRDMDALRRAAA